MVKVPSMLVCVLFPFGMIFFCLCTFFVGGVTVFCFV